MAGSASGGAVICLALFTVTAGNGPTVPGIGPMLAGAGGLLAGGLVAWSLGRPLGNAYHRAVVSMIAVFGTALIGALTVPAHVVAGRAGLAALGIVSVAVVAVSRRLFAGRDG